MTKYMALVTYPKSRDIQVLSTGQNNYVIASEDKKILILFMCQQLLAEGVITSFQIVVTTGQEDSIEMKNDRLRLK